MLHPLISTMIGRPDLLMDHLSGYAALFHEEASEAASELIKRSLAWALATVCAAVFLMLTGVAVMLGLLLNQFHWVLIAMPVSMLVLTGLAIVKARMPMNANRFAGVKEQANRDALALRAVS